MNGDSGYSFLPQVFRNRGQVAHNKEIFDRLTRKFPLAEVKEPSYFSKESGGFYVIYNGHQKKKVDVERELAKLLADKGFIVRLFPEGDDYPQFAVDGKFKEGKIGRAWYEQKTPDNRDKGLKETLDHAHTKRADVAICYSPKGGFYEDNDIERSIGRYKGQGHSHEEVKYLMIVNGKDQSVDIWDVDKTQKVPPIR